MILLTLSRGKGKETVRLQLPASPAEIGEAFASLDRISLDTTATAILDVSSNVGSCTRIFALVNDVWNLDFVFGRWQMGRARTDAAFIIV